ncbi:MAG: RHS repeat-associated core domain-containing protein [Phycisphaerales bacterium]
MRTRLAGMCFVGGLLLALANSKGAEPILSIHEASLTTYKATTATSVQDAFPRAANRGVGLDGTLRAPATFDWAINGNPFEATREGEWNGSLRLSTGAFAPTTVDLALPAEIPWIIGRTYNPRQADGETLRTSDGYQGLNWFQTSQPEIVVYRAVNASTKSADDLVYIVYGADRYIEFKRAATDSDAFRGVNGAAGIILYREATETDGDTYTYYDPHGLATWFFGEDEEYDAAKHQIWKIVNAAGICAHVGSPDTPGTEPTNAFDGAESGYCAHGGITVAYDSKGRRFDYGYNQDCTETNTPLRLARIDVTDQYRDWSDPQVIASVLYNYYPAPDPAYVALSVEGNLKSVYTTWHSRTTNYGKVEERHYRYYTVAEAGRAGLVKMVVERDGAREADWSGDQCRNYSSSGYNALTATHDVSDDTMKPYSDAYFTYHSDATVATAFFNGECGCGGGSNGLRTYTYQGNNGTLASATSGYDAAWASRVIVQPPTGGAWLTQYFDELGQALSAVFSDVDPASSGTTDRWVAAVERGSSGGVASVATPAAVATYTHNDSSTIWSGAIALRTDAGLITLTERVSDTSSAFLGFERARKETVGSGGTPAYTTWTDHTSKSMPVTTATPAVDLIRPLVSEQRRYHTATSNATTSGTFDSTGTTYSVWSTSGTLDTQRLAIKRVDTSPPTIATTTNGSGEGEPTSVFFRPNGTPIFSLTARGILTYVKYRDGQVVKRIEDASLEEVASDPSDPDDPEDYDFPSGGSQTTGGAGPQNLTSTSSYLPSGQPRGVKTPDGQIRLTGQYPLHNGQSMKVSTAITNYGHDGGGPGGPDGHTTPEDEIDDTEDSCWDFGGSPCGTLLTDGGKPSATFSLGMPDGTHGFPMSGLTLGSGGNQAMTNVEPIPGPACGVIDDPLKLADALGIKGAGGPVRFSAYTRFIYDKTGNKLLEKQQFHRIPHLTSTTVPSGLLGTLGDDYDRETMAYDDLGRLVRHVDMTGTITRFEYDVLGRLIRRRVGTNDTTSNNLITVEELEYDGDNAGGNSLLTTRTMYPGDGTSRETTYIYDGRSRLVGTNNPVAPHTAMALDNRGRATATGIYSDAVSASTNPLTTTTARLGLSEDFFDARGNTWKMVTHNISQTGSNAGDSLESKQTLNWFDPDGRLIKTLGDEHVKLRYNRLGRLIQRFELASDNDDGYEDVYDFGDGWVNLDDDTVLEEAQTRYNPFDGRPVLSVHIARLPGDDETLGALDPNGTDDRITNPGEGEPDLEDGEVRFIFKGSEVLGRAQITATWYDANHRPVKVANFGTGAGSGNAGDFTYRSPIDCAPTESSGSVMLTTTEYFEMTPTNAGSIESNEWVKYDTGRVGTVTDAHGRKALSIYDSAGRVLSAVANYTYTPYTEGPTDVWPPESSPDESRDKNVFTNYKYIQGQMTAMWVDVRGNDWATETYGHIRPAVPDTTGSTNASDQVTRYIYGVTAGTSPGDSLVTREDLLRQAIYPPQFASQAESARRMDYAYNALEEPIFVTDQNGTQIENRFDLAGREYARIASIASGSGIDDRVLRVDTAYDARGMTQSITQMSNPNGTGVLDQVRYTYDGWGNLALIQQDPDGTAITDPANTATAGNEARVAFTHALDSASATGVNARQTVRRTGQSVTTYTGTAWGLKQSVAFDFDTSSSDPLADLAARVSGVQSSLNGASLTEAATYPKYLGAEGLVETGLPIDTRSTLAAGTGAAMFDGYLDRFNRVVRSEWSHNRAGENTWRSTYSVDLAYNAGGDLIGSTDAKAPGRDADYIYDNMGRLVRSKEGTRESGAITTTTRDEVWGTVDGSTVTGGLSQTGNWLTRSVDLAAVNADPAATLLESSTYTLANEWSTRSLLTDPVEDPPAPLVLDFTTAGSAPLAYDPAGNLRDDRLRYRFTYDAFGRIVAARGRVQASGVYPLLAEYRYNGLGHKVAWRHAAVAGEVMTGSEAWVLGVFDDRWRLIATRPGDAYGVPDDEQVGVLDETYVYHAAGADGTGGSSYIDSVILRTRRNAAGMDGLVYYAQNWRADVVLLLEGQHVGLEVERVRYSAYGVPSSTSPLDYNHDGSVNPDDVGDFITDYYTTPPIASTDFNDDDNYSPDDLGDFITLYYDDGRPDGGLGRGRLGSFQIGNIKGYAGYEWDPVLSGPASGEGEGTLAACYYHVRYRVYDAAGGRWTRRDPIGYVADISLVRYVLSTPLTGTDPSGLYPYDGLLPPGDSDRPRWGPPKTQPRTTYPNPPSEPVKGNRPIEHPRGDCGITIRQSKGIPPHNWIEIREPGNPNVDGIGFYPTRKNRPVDTGTLYTPGGQPTSRCNTINGPDPHCGEMPTTIWPSYPTSTPVPVNPQLPYGRRTLRPNLIPIGTLPNGFPLLVPSDKTTCKWRRDCVRNATLNWRYVIPFQQCWTAVDEILRQCGMERGPGTPVAPNGQPGNPETLVPRPDFPSPRH